MALYTRIFLLLGMTVLGVGLAVVVFRWQHQPPVVFISPIASTSPDASFTATAFSLVDAPSESLRGEIVQMDGEVLWQSRVATMPAALNKPIVLQQGEVVQTGGDGALVIMLDELAGLTLASDTKVELVQTLPLQLVFNQYMGEAEYSASGGSPVSVRAGWLLVTLMKGQLTVVQDVEQGLITVTLARGAATVAYNDLDFQTQVVELTKGKVFEFDNNKRIIID